VTVDPLNMGNIKMYLKYDTGVWHGFNLLRVWASGKLLSTQQ
jgi:hypothetical protein